MKNLLVTGADGFIGSHLTETLVWAGYNVRAFVHYNSINSWGWLDESPEEIKHELDVFTGAIRDPHGGQTAVEGCDAVLNLVALIAILYSYHSPDMYIDTNVKAPPSTSCRRRESSMKGKPFRLRPAKYMEQRSLCRLLRDILCKANLRIRRVK